MSRILFTLTAVLFAVAFSYGEPLPTLSPPVLSTENTISFIDPKCDAALKLATKTCNSTTEVTWKATKVYKEMTEAEKKGDKVKFDQLKLQLTCCSTWDLIHCTELGTGDKCNEKDYQFVWAMLEWGKAELQRQHCQAYPYNDRAEKCKKD